jgi:hypothetical protein
MIELPRYAYYALAGLFVLLLITDIMLREWTSAILLIASFIAGRIWSRKNG